MKRMRSIIGEQDSLACQQLDSDRSNINWIMTLGELGVEQRTRIKCPIKVTGRRLNHYPIHNFYHAKRRPVG